DPPVNAEHEVAELLLGPEALVSGGLAAGVDVDYPAHDLPMAIVAGRDLPAGEVAAVEERDEAVGGGRHATAAQGGGTNESESNGHLQQAIHVVHCSFVHRPHPLFIAPPPHPSPRKGRGTRLSDQLRIIDQLSWVIDPHAVMPTPSA